MGDWKNIALFSVISLSIGLGGGYLLFAKKSTNPSQETSPAMDHHHHEEGEIYTCSMHPQIRQNEMGICPICEMDLTLASTSQNSDPLVLEMTKEAMKLAAIETTVIGTSDKGTTTGILKLNGKIQADERRSSSLVSHLPGRIEQLHVSFTGEYVRTGQKLATIYSPELISAQRELIEAARLRKVNPALLDAAKSKLRNWKISEEQIRMLEMNFRIQENFILRAEASGVVSNKKVSVGDHVSEGQVLFEVTDLNRLWVILDAYEEDLSKIKMGDQVSFTTPGIPDQSFTTRINFIDPTINPATRVASVRGEISNARSQLKPEMLIMAQLAQKANKTATQLLVPRTAVMWTGKRSVAYVKEKDKEMPSFRYQELKLGDRIGENYVVLDGLEPGAEVVTYGNFVIDAAAQLNNQQSMMNDLVQKQGGPDTPELPDFLDESPAAFQAELHELFQIYIPLKDALVATDGEGTQILGKRFAEQLSQTGEALADPDQVAFWSTKKAQINAHIQRINASDDVEKQRKQFKFISDLLIQAAQVYGTGGQEYYLQHCPMAFNDTGADWISEADTILNPYFGDKMLKCGFVKMTLP
ncbi:MAG: efflux RND transporter periplasmic adaptor subunit [Bacteroidota bacterium]